MRVMWLAAWVFVAGGAAAAPSGMEDGLVRDAFKALAAGPNVALADQTRHTLQDPARTDAAWAAFFERHGDAIGFSPQLAEFWDYAIRTSGADGARLRFLSGLCAGAVAGRTLQHVGGASYAQHFAAGASALTWLEQIAGALAPASRAQVFEQVHDVARKNRAARAALLGGGLAPRQAWLHMQLCLTLARYAERPEQLADVVQLPVPLAAFWREHGVFLFDGGALDAAQYGSLSAVLGGFPRGSHAIAALLVPAGLGAGMPKLMTPGQLVNIDPIPLSVLSDPAEFVPRVGQAVGAAFPLEAGVRIVRAIQAVQLAERPDLAVKRDRILFRAGIRPERYVRQTVNPAVYFDDPDELLPLTAYIWLLDSGLTFRAALELLEVRQREAMDTVLLLADLLSGGLGAAPLFRVGPGGQVMTDAAPLARTQVDRLRVQQPDGALVDEFVPANLSFVTGIGVAGSFWAFDLNDVGSVFRYERR